MEKEFVPFELAVKLKELGFDLKPIQYFGVYKVSFPIEGYALVKCGIVETIDDVVAPLWQQAFDWFRKKGFECAILHHIPEMIEKGHGDKYAGYIWKQDLNPRIPFSGYYPTYEEARLSCLEKLIELVTEKK